VCDAVICPKLECSQPVLMEGDCCGTCDADPVPDGEDGPRRGCVLDGDKKFRAAGSHWHPYIPPFGFSQCVTCTCQPDTLQIVCKPKQCPVLTCTLDLQERPEPGACCKVRMGVI
jgi:chordin